MIALGSTIGILGGGQLGRMLILAGRAMGYRFHIYEPSGPCPAGQVADLEINASYSDQAALKAFAEGVDVITLEFENIPAEVIDQLSAIKPIFPGKQALHICQNRQRERTSKRAASPASHSNMLISESLKVAIKTVGFPCVIKLPPRLRWKRPSQNRIGSSHRGFGRALDKPRGTAKGRDRKMDPPHR